MLLLVPVIFTALCWLVSLRRTPWAVPWLVGSAGMAGVGVLIEAAVLTIHHTVPGVVAGLLAGAVLPGVSAVGTELCATYGPETRHGYDGSYTTKGDPVWRWRNERHASRRRLPSRDRWEVRSYSIPEGVRLYVERGQAKRLIGEADPLADMDAFMELRVKADQAAETLNALKIDA